MTLAHCIKTGMDNPGHPHIKTVGLTAGDEESYSTFKELFDPIISDRHNGYGVDAKQPTDMDISKISDTDIDPFNKSRGECARGPLNRHRIVRKLAAACSSGEVCAHDARAHGALGARLQAAAGDRV